MKIIKINLPRELKRIAIIPLADIHIGDPHCDEEALKKTIEYIRKNKDVYCVCNGDLMNTALKTSVSDVYSEVLSPMEQLIRVRDLLAPIKDKILGITNGNHEARVYKAAGIDTSMLLAKELGIENRYAAESAVLFLKFGQKEKEHKNQQMQYTIFMNHGWGGGRKVGGKLNSLEEVVGVVDTDIYLHSHTHLPAVFKQNFYRTNLPHQSVEEVEKLFVNTNAFLKYGGYGEALEFRPASRSVPMIFLSGTERIMEAKI
jgi:predicted phosphodiesterase